MMRKSFEENIRKVKDDIVTLGNMVEEATVQSVEALKARDLSAAQNILEMDKRINQMRFDIEREIMLLIATQQPMAHDLRLLASCFEISSELERMGDYAKGIAVINLRMGDQPLLKPLVDIPRMAQKATEMLHRALEAFIQEDITAAQQIPLEDDEIDHLYNQVYRELITYILADPTTIERANWLLWAAHNLERMADRITNICERIIFISTGEIEEMDVSYDELEEDK
ncbi:MAG: phosphate signaling complex protein PhoU [Chloroflexota bacterium]